MVTGDLQLIAQDGGELVLPSGARNKQNSILFWAESYWKEKVVGSPDGTIRAKKTDLELFLSFFGEVVGSNHVDYWTPSVSKSFRTWLEKANPRKPKRRYKKAYAPTSINRTLATLRHFAKHIAESRKFEAGDPLAGLKDLETPEPEWNGLEDIALMRLRAALDQVTQLAGRANQMPLRNRAVFIVALDTGLRAFELEGLDYEQYQGKYLKRVKGKGHSYADIYLSADARAELDEYIAEERGDEDGALFLTNRDGRISRQQIDRFMRQVANHANSKLSPENQIQLHTHMLRHTSTKRVYEKKGPVAAKKHGRHQSFKQLERYAAPTREEHEDTVDNLWS